MKILTIVPAHNEEPTLDSCINGIRNQTIETDILVVCDNCTDKTEQLAQSLEVNTLKTINNVHKKSGNGHSDGLGWNWRILRDSIRNRVSTRLAHCQWGLPVNLNC